MGLDLLFSRKLMISSRSLFETDYVACVDNGNVIAAIHTDGLWSFPTDLNEGFHDCKKYKTADALKIIEMLSPDVMVQHMHCDKRHTYSALFEVLSIPFVGSDSQVSANIVDKGKRNLNTNKNVLMFMILINHMCRRDESDFDTGGSSDA